MTGEACWKNGAIRWQCQLGFLPTQRLALAYSIVDGLGLLNDDQILGWGLEGVWEGSFGLFEPVYVSVVTTERLGKGHT